MEKLLFRPSEVADLLGLGRTRVYSVISNGETPSVRIEGSVRVPAEALRSWVEKRIAEGASATAG